MHQELDAANPTKMEDKKKEEEGPKYPMPDVGQMIPFKPKIVHGRIDNAILILQA